MIKWRPGQESNLIQLPSEGGGRIRRPGLCDIKLTLRVLGSVSVRKHYRYYVVYRTTNLITGGYYIGMHCTNKLDDGYLGSGKILKAAINKYGRNKFRRRILRYCSSREQMIYWEKKYVAKHLGRPKCYNLAEGGHGGWHHVNAVAEKRTWGFSNVAGNNNPQYGKCWIAHDEARLTMRVRREEVQDYFDAGWRPGRVMRYEHVKDYLLELP